MTMTALQPLEIQSPYDGLTEKESFFALVRKYDWHLRYLSSLDDEEYISVGEDGPPSKEKIQFTTQKATAYSAHKITYAERDGQDTYNFFVDFMGLLGTSGVLPHHYSKLAQQRLKQGDEALVDFIGMFEHRLLSFYYKSWAKYKLALAIERTERLLEDAFSKVIKSLSGYFEGPLTQLYYSGHFAKANRSMSNLESLLKEVLDESAYIEPLQGRWLPIEKNDRCKIGQRGQNHSLGNGVLLGKRYWDIQSKIVVGVKNMTMQQFESLRPKQPKYELVKETINAYVPNHIDVYLKLHIQSTKGEVCTLGKKLQLSENFWLASQQKNTLISLKRLHRM